MNPSNNDHRLLFFISNTDSDTQSLSAIKPFKSRPVATRSSTSTSVKEASANRATLQNLAPL